MLEQLFGSRTRTKLLHLFLENKEQSFFVREICRAINERINSVRRELQNLEKFGLIISKTVEQKRFYKIDGNFPIVSELQLLFDKSKILIEKMISQKALKLEGLKYFALTGQFTKEEDIPTDVLLVGKIPREALEKFIKGIEKTYGRHIRYTYFTTQEFNLRKDLTDKFLYSIINGQKIVLVNKIGI
ncbi:winged helix-turn-helix domain-containing protein [Patescibacteria group bacterium]|nr:winged helix-turn-helix domain-containing protein [Patescibacteria group bacterium]